MAESDSSREQRDHQPQVFLAIALTFIHVIGIDVVRLLPTLSSESMTTKARDSFHQFGLVDPTVKLTVDLDMQSAYASSPRSPTSSSPLPKSSQYDRLAIGGM